MDSVAQESNNAFGSRSLDFETNVSMVFSKCLDILISKRKVYGTKNIIEQGVLGVLDRVQYDKLSRVSNILTTNHLRSLLVDKYNMDQPTVDKHIPALDGGDETIDDTLLDVINYMVIIVALKEGWWKNK